MRLYIPFLWGYKYLQLVKGRNCNYCLKSVLKKCYDETDNSSVVFFPYVCSKYILKKDAMPNFILKPPSGIYIYMLHVDGIHNLIM